MTVLLGFLAGCAAGYGGWLMLRPTFAAPIFQHPGYSRFVRSILVAVAQARPTVASVAATPPQVCIGGDPTADSDADATPSASAPARLSADDPDDVR